MPLIWVIAFFILAALSALIMNMKGRGGGKFFLKLMGGALALDIVSLWALQGMESRGLYVTVIAMTVGLLGLVLAIFSPSTKQLAVQDGQHGDYRKCPFCAEPVRKEAVKCKHCQSLLSIPEQPERAIEMGPRSDDR